MPAASRIFARRRIVVSCLGYFGGGGGGQLSPGRHPGRGAEPKSGSGLFGVGLGTGVGVGVACATAGRGENPPPIARVGITVENASKPKSKASSE